MREGLRAAENRPGRTGRVLIGPEGVCPPASAAGDHLPEPGTSAPLRTCAGRNGLNGLHIACDGPHPQPSTYM